LCSLAADAVEDRAIAIESRAAINRRCGDMELPGGHNVASAILWSFRVERVPRAQDRNARRNNP